MLDSACPRTRVKAHLSTPLDDSALGPIKDLCEADRAGLRFIVPLRADTGFAQRFLDEVGHDGLHPIRYVSRREQPLPATQRTRYRGALRDCEVIDPETANTTDYACSSSAAA